MRICVPLSHLLFRGPINLMRLYVCDCNSKVCANYFVCRPHIRNSKCVHFGWHPEMWIALHTSNMQTELVNEHHCIPWNALYICWHYSFFTLTWLYFSFSLFASVLFSYFHYRNTYEAISAIFDVCVETKKHWF